MNKIEKIRALLRLAHNQRELPEGHSARHHALQLMKKYSVTAQELGSDAHLLDEITTPEERTEARAASPDLASMRIDTSLRVPQEAWKRSLMFAIAQHVGLEMRLSAQNLMLADRPAAYQRWKLLYQSLEEKIADALSRLPHEYAKHFSLEIIHTLQDRLPSVRDGQLQSLRIDLAGYRPGRPIPLLFY
jgi:hypothetical protein